MAYTETDRRNDFQWFLENYDVFFEKYGIAYIAIQNKEVLGVYSDLVTAIDETKQTKALGDFIVQLCNGNETGYTNYIASNEVGVI